MGEAIQTLPHGTPLTYFAEGAANIVYRLPSGLFPGKLLRLNKALPSRVAVSTSHAQYNSTFHDLLPAEHLVEQTLIQIPRSVLEQCNASLLALEAENKRHPKRAGLYLALEEEHGLLMTDMTPDTSQGEILIEFKPKWLAQSPSAPKGSKRCRTCALRARNNAKRKAKGKAPEQGFCPLDLVAPSAERVERAVKKAGKGKLDEEVRLENAVGCLQRSSILEKLKGCQLLMDPKGVFEADLFGKEFGIAMTVRDCTVFMKIPSAHHEEIELRLADLDLKSPLEGKAEYWKALEQELIDGGWYAGSEKDADADKTWCEGLEQ